MLPTPAVATEPLAEDVYFKKLVTFNHRGRSLRFRVAQELFSSHEVDTGTQRLLRTLLDHPAGPARTILDLGCGYGPIGLALKRFDAGRIVHLVDRDALALAYCRQNAGLNGLEPVTIYGSLGYTDVTTTNFDLIASNIPAKAGEHAITAFLLDARSHLTPDGSVAVVVVSRLEPLVDRVLETPDIEIVLRKGWPGHTVYQYRFRGPPTPPAQGRTTDLYCHETVTWQLGDATLSLDLAHDLPDLDPRQADLLLERFVRPSATPARATIVNPGQGWVALAVWRLLRPTTLLLADRDLLSLRVTRANLIANGCPATAITLQHQVGLPADGWAPSDLIACVARDDERPETQAALLRQAAHRLAPGGIVLLVGSATAIARAETMLRDCRLTLVERKRKRGAGLLVARGG